jgi:hypothetical protein
LVWKRTFHGERAFFGQESAVFSGDVPFFPRNGGGRAQKTAFPMKKGVLLAGKDVSDRRKGVSEVKRTFFCRKTVFSGRRWMS